MLVLRSMEKGTCAAGTAAIPNNTSTTSFFVLFDAVSSLCDVPTPQIVPDIDMIPNVLRLLR